MESFSLTLSHTLDHLGYNQDMVQFRRDTWQDLISYQSDRNVNFIIAGSKPEGITSLYESDVDLMALHKQVMCIHTADQLSSQLPDKTVVFLADMENTPPGYTRLKLHLSPTVVNVHESEVMYLVRHCLCESEKGKYYLSSASWTSYCETGFGISALSETACKPVKGPALPATFDYIDYDVVVGFTCHCPKYLQTWSSRRRQHDWPSDDTIRIAGSFQPQVVPVGAKGSERHDQEWRFCFIESELTLTQSLNETQIKLYIVLKMVAKLILKEITEEISSYIMKNVTYWLSELLPLEVFREEKLAWLVLVGLATLRSAITRWQNLPYYMIPSRNLLLERLDASTQSKVSVLLWMLIREGPLMFLRIQKLREGLEAAYRRPSKIGEFGNIRDEIEKISLPRGLYVKRKNKTLHDLVVAYKRLQDVAWNGDQKEVINEAKRILS